MRASSGRCSLLRLSFLPIWGCFAAYRVRFHGSPLTGFQRPIPLQQRERETIGGVSKQAVRVGDHEHRGDHQFPNEKRRCLMVSALSTLFVCQLYTGIRYFSRFEKSMQFWWIPGWYLCATYGIPLFLTSPWWYLPGTCRAVFWRELLLLLLRRRRHDFIHVKLLVKCSYPLTCVVWCRCLATRRNRPFLAA